eukprot:m.71519 g.71519  ORF g.71519 m.71519 type:complete len:319 (-) comp8714_c0_seq1:88-1044(-)
MATVTVSSPPHSTTESQLLSSVEVKRLDLAPAPTVDDVVALDCDDATSETSERSSQSVGRVVDPYALTDALARIRVVLERERLTPDFLSTTQRDGQGGVSLEGRRDLLIWLREFNLFFGLSPLTYAIAAALVDRMLEATRVKPEHADLVGVACLLIAAKDNETAELRPTLRELSRNCDGAFSESDIKRMEGLVIKRLGLGPGASLADQVVTSLEFLDEVVHFSVLMGVSTSIVATASFEALTTNVLLSCTFHYEIMSFRPSTLALAVLDLELTRTGGPRLYAEVIERIGDAMQVPAWDVTNCRKAIARCLRLRPHLAV